MNRGCNCAGHNGILNEKRNMKEKLISVAEVNKYHYIVFIIINL